MTEQKVGPNPALWPRGGARVEALRFRRAPLLAAAMAFALGEVVGVRVDQPAVVLLALVVLLVGLVWVSIGNAIDDAPGRAFAQFVQVRGVQKKSHVISPFWQA